MPTATTPERGSIVGPINYTSSQDRAGVRVRGTAIKRMTCDRCHAAYEYEISRSAGANSAAAQGGAAGGLIGAAIGAAVDASRNQEKQQQGLRERVAKSLDDGFEMVACPKCGWHEPRVVKEARRRRLRWLTVVGALALVAGAAVLLMVTVAANSSSPPHVEPSVYVYSTLACGAGLVMLVLRWVVIGRYDVNDLPKGSPAPTFKGAPTAVLVDAGR